MEPDYNELMKEYNEASKELKAIMLKRREFLLTELQQAEDRYSKVQRKLQQYRQGRDEDYYLELRREREQQHCEKVYTEAHTFTGRK